MYSHYTQFEKYLEDVKFKYTAFGNIRIVFYSLLVLLSVVTFLKYALKRRNYMKIYPARKVGLFNPWGNVQDFIRNENAGRITLNVYILQILMGYKEIFKHENFFYFGLGYSPFIVVTKAKAVEELISGSRNMEKSWLYRWLHPWLGTGLLTSHGGKWKSRRKLLTPSFHFDILKDFLPIFNEQSQMLVKLLKEETKQPWTDIVKPITLCSLDIVCETTLGVSVGAQKDSESEYVQAVSRASESFMSRLIYPPYYLDWYFSFSREGSQFKKDVKMLHDFTRTVIADKKHKLLASTNAKEETAFKKRKALMDLLLEEHVTNGTLTEEDIREEVDTFAFEGHDTTSMGMSWALYLIGLYKDVQEKIHEDLDRVFGDDHERFVTTDDLKDLEYLDRVLKEAQRLYPSVPFFGRSLSGDTTLCGRKVPKEVPILILTYGLHRDENAFPNPEKFDPDRFLPENTVKRSPFAYIPFSAGPRNCIGQRFALMEEKVVIINVLRNYTVESLDPRDKVLSAPELILRAAVPIRIKLRSRRPS